MIIDVFARVRGRSSQQVSAYEADYAPLALLKGIADRFGVAILVLHHTRKAGAEDFMDEVSGTQGLNGAADATLVLKRSRGQADATLQVSGRDIEETAYALSFAADIGTWTLLDGPAEDYTLSDTRRAILDYLREHGPCTPKQIADGLKVEHNTVKQRAWQMARDGQLNQADGLYLPAITHNPHNRVTQDHPSGYGGYDPAARPSPGISAGHAASGYGGYEGYEGSEETP